MAKGLSLHIGINHVNPGCYDGAKHTVLRGCKNDALAMYQIAVRNGFHVMDILLDQRATRDAVEHYICQAASTLHAGDTFMLTYSGHGAQMSRGWNDPTPDEGGRMEGEYDEALVLSDWFLIDDEIFGLLKLFVAGTNIIFVCDSCNSCSIYEFAANKPQAVRKPIEHQTHHDGVRLKLMEEHIVKNHIKKHLKQYQERKRNSRKYPSQLHAQVVVLSACEDGRTAADGRVNGRFTTALLDTLAYRGHDGKPFSGSYNDYMTAVIHHLDGTSQSPCFTPLGADTTNKFFQGPPFTIYKES